MKIVISSGHGKLVRGASGYLDEVDEARRVVDSVFPLFGDYGMAKFHDDVSTSQNENLHRIVDFHNSQNRDLDVSVHFNAYMTTNAPMGTECLYITQSELAQKVATKVSNAAGFIDRGPKKRTDLFFLNNTNKPAILIEVCFCDSLADSNLYSDSFDKICAAIVSAITGVTPPPPESGPSPETKFKIVGKASYFGGPNDQGVSPNEGLAFITTISQAPHLFLPDQPSGTSGLARRLNPYVHYVACRWDYTKTPKTVLLAKQAMVKAIKTGISLKAFPADWGPHEDTGRVADLSPTLMDDLGIQTDDEVEVAFLA